MIKQSDCTIIIPHLGKTLESQYALKQCLKSLRETCDMRIIVAYNGVEGWDGNVDADTMLLSDQGQCKAVNAAVATTNTPWIFVTNDDMIYAPGWWEKLTEPLGRRWITNNREIKEIDIRPHGIIEVDVVSAVNEIPEILCISPKLVEPRQGAPTFIEYFCGGAGGDFNKEKWLEFANNYHAMEAITGFNLPFLIKRELWDTIGGYDINYDPWGSNSDSDLEYKIKLAGVQPYQNTNCVVYHFSQTSGTFEPRNDEYRFKNYEYFKQKWGFDRTDDGIWEATFNIPTKEEGRIFNPPWENKYGRLS